MTNGSSKIYDLAVVGSGIHGVHLSAAVVESGAVEPDRMVMVDPHDDPLALWDTRVRNCCMEYLRSPASHGMAADFYSLRRSMRSPDDWIPPYHRPRKDLFRRHAAERIKILAPCVSRVTGRVDAIFRDETGFHLHVHNGRNQVIRSRTAILCPGMPRPNVPDFAIRSGAYPERIQHVYESSFDPDGIMPEERVLIVGGGIGALHLAAALAERGTTVTMWSRDRMTVEQFDSDPCFIGPRCGTTFEKIKDDKERVHTIRTNRRPGSVPADLYDRFKRDLDSDKYVHGYVEVISVMAERDGLHVTGRTSHHGKDTSVRDNETTQVFDRLVLCTGFRDEPPARDLVARMARELPAPLGAEGYPLIDRDLSWVPGLYVTGGLADLILGPPARNIIGAHLARRRILPSLTTFIGDR